MKIRLENKLQNYMNENGHKDLVVYVTACNTWGGPVKNVSARFAEGNEELLLNMGYETTETELGQLYYHPNQVIMSDSPQLSLGKFLWMPVIRMRGIRAA